MSSSKLFTENAALPLQATGWYSAVERLCKRSMKLASWLKSLPGGLHHEVWRLNSSTSLLLVVLSRQTSRRRALRHLISECCGSCRASAPTYHTFLMLHHLSLQHILTGILDLRVHRSVDLGMQPSWHALLGISIYEWLACNLPAKIR